MVSMERFHWGLRIPDLADVPSINARLQEITGLPGTLLHPVGGLRFALTPSAEAWVEEHWEDDEIIKTQLRIIPGVQVARYIQSRTILPEQATMDPANPTAAQTDAFYDWGDSSEPPEAQGTSWYHRMCRFPEAWDICGWLSGPAPRGRFPIGHVDTGTSNHPAFRPLANAAGEPGFMRVDRGTNTMGDGNGPVDPLDGVMGGHGTRIGSVIYGDLPGRFLGGAPGCEVIPIRVGDSVIISDIFGDAVTSDPDDVAAGIRHAVDQGCGVVNISMGGPQVSDLQEACELAYRAGTIICAAAGNVVQTPQNPAALPTTIALAAINRTGRPWSSSARGKIVDISAPGEGIWRGGQITQNGVSSFTFGNDGSGTSYATALTSAAAALWLTHRGDELEGYEGWQRIEAFRFCLRGSADLPKDNAFLQQELGVDGALRVPWDSALFGKGILNVEHLLELPLPAVDTLKPAIAL